MALMYVLKIGGNEIDQPDLLSEICAAVSAIASPGVIVHGGGKETGAALTLHGVDFTFVDGMRATSTAAMTVVEQVMSRTINKRVVAQLNAAGIQAIGLSGVDLHLLQARRLR